VSLSVGDESDEVSTFVWALSLVPRALASRIHIVGLFALGLFLILLPVTGLFVPSSNAMLIGGNYTNVTSDLGACIAAGGTVTILHRQSRRHAEQRAHEAAIIASNQALHDHLGTGHIVGRPHT
jgi:hypothetical protein